jgi:hypothetical protein
MKKLNLEALKQRAEATASTELLATISGGTENSCHDNIAIWAEVESQNHILTPVVKWIFNLFN